MRIAYRRSSRNQFYNFWVEPTGVGNHNLPHTHVQAKIYREFYHCIVYIANEGRHVRMIN
jgi:hypothetical protein